MERVVLWHRLVPEGRGELDTEFNARWADRVATRLRAVGGTVLVSLGSSVVVELETLDLRLALDTALELLVEARAKQPSVRACFGAACGELRDDDPPFVGIAPARRGAALDRAQLLANRARVGELVLDPRARELAASMYLFRRQVRAGAGSMRGQAVDPKYPRRDMCRPSIRHLGVAPIPPATAEVLGRVKELATATGRHRIVLRGPIGAGAREWIDALERDHAPPLVLRIESVPGSLEPLGSLRFALLRRWGSPQAVRDALGEVEGETLRRIASGHAVDRMFAAAAFSALLEQHGTEGRPWLVLDPLAAIDPATVEIVGEVTSAGPEALIIARLPLDARVPTPLLKTGEPEEFTLPLLRTPDARSISEAILGPKTSEDVARRVAVLGGETPFGVAEAARTLIACGDLVRDGDHFVWRIGPRGGVSAEPIEMLLEERLGSLEPTPLRILEAVCSAPSGAPTDVLLRVMHADGIGEAEAVVGVEQLRTEALLRPADPWQATSNVLRAVVVQSMPPARTSELYRFVADTMSALADSQAEFSRATIGYFLAEGGHEHEGARALLEAGRAAALSDFSRSAVRLAAASVQFDPSKEIRRAASHLSRVSTARRSAGSELPPPPTDTQAGVAPVAERASQPEVSIAREADDLRHSLVSALLDGDFENVDSLIDMAIAEGYERAAADRVRGVAFLLRGDMEHARESIANSRGYPQQAESAERTQLATALVRLAAGRPDDAAHLILRVLASAQRRGNESARRAALLALATCCDATGRTAQAASLRVAPK